MPLKPAVEPAAISSYKKIQVLSFIVIALFPFARAETNANIAWLHCVNPSPEPFSRPPAGPFRFVEEDTEGTNPKIVVLDPAGAKWTVKMGAEAAPETAAVRITWAAGYYSSEVYFLKTARIEGMPAKLRRGNEFAGHGGMLANVRLKRNQKKSGTWSWKDPRLAGSQELDGLRVLMALMNNWDVTDENTGIYDDPEGGPPIYMVSDLGSTFGTGDLSWPLKRGRGDLEAYRHSAFITQQRPDAVDFHTPARPSPFFLFTPHEYAHKLDLRWIGRGIPRVHARWIGERLGQIPGQQIRDAFRAAGYDERHIEAFASVVEQRIAQLRAL